MASLAEVIFKKILDLDEIKQDVHSRLWFTYRKNFAPIGDSSLSSDQGWGCMLRCGQMLLAEAMLRRHLGRDWLWSRVHVSPTYANILRQFQDKRSAMFSIHQIAQMGVSEGKPVGEWFGPNTVAHVLKKLTIYDEWSRLVVHVAMDNILIMDDVRQLCSTPFGPLKSSSPLPNDSQKSAWNPLILIVPLRLGLTNLNPVYFHALKEYFMLRQCCGMIGGRPNHALYFLGTVGDELLYLDPHFNQASVDLDADLPQFDDTSYHCPFLLRISVANIDPSLALSFYCGTKEEFDDLCNAFEKSLLRASDPPLFELLAQRPKGWPPFVPYRGEQIDDRSQDYHVLDGGQYDSEDEFELLT